MSNTVRKLILDDGWSIGRNECWFADMAAQGLHLKGMGRLFASFEKGEPQRTKYRIDVLSSPPTAEQMEIYQQCGWKFVARNGDFTIFSSPEEGNCPELHTDPIEQSYTLAALDKRLRNNLIVISAAMLLFLGMMFSMFVLDPTPTLSLVERSAIQQIILVVVELYVFFTVIRNFVAVRTLRQSLLAGLPVNHRENWKKHRIINGLAGAFFIFLGLLSILIPFAGMIKSQDYTLPETAVDLPIIRLAQIEQNPNLQREVIYNSRGVDWGNRVRYDWSPLAPIQYEVNEHGIIRNETWPDQSGEYSPSLEIRYYQLTYAPLADGLIDDLQERYVYTFDPNVVIQEFNHASFDRMVVVQDGIKKEIFAGYGHKVIYVRYYGNREAEHIVSLLSQHLSME